MTVSNAIERPSPNHGPRPDGVGVDFLVLHYTGMRTCAESLARLCDPAAKVSAHYLIDEDGALYSLVDEAMRAWHAGVSHWAGVTDINRCSIGIELQNPGHEFGYLAFPGPQMDTLIALIQGILSRHAIPPARVIGHSDIAPSRKQDPGERFDWQRLAAEGIGRWPDITNTVEPTRLDDTAARALLSTIGYDPDTDLSVVLSAFQRHYRPAIFDGRLDSETSILIRALAG